MSEYKVCLTKILKIDPHLEADRLELATVYGFQVVVKKGMYVEGDSVFYIPIDSVLPQDLEDRLFPHDSKIRLHKHRVRQIRIRKFASQGMLVSVEDILAILAARGVKSTFDYDKDYAELLGIFKYEPPAPSFQTAAGGRKVKPLNNPLFHTYNGLSNLKWFPTLFKEDEEVVVQEKLHGTNARFGYLPSVANTFWKKVLKFFNLLPKFEYVYGSNNVELTNRTRTNQYYGYDVYGTTFERIKAKDKVKENEIIYGEIVGPSIQKNYDYGHRKETHFVLFDVKKVNEDETFTWLTPEDVVQYGKERGFDVVPTLYIGNFNADLVKKLTEGDSVYCPSQKIREGVVVKSRLGYNDEYCSSSRRSLKVISEKYLDKDNTDFH